MPVAKSLLVRFWHQQEDRWDVVDRFFVLAREVRPSVIETLIAKSSWFVIINVAENDDVLVLIVDILVELFGRARQCEDHEQPFR